jgi:hypothetical protein
MHVRITRGSLAATALLSVISVLSAGSAAALPRYGPLEVSGSISAQQLTRFNPAYDTYAFVQQRNTVKLRVDYSLLNGGKLIDRYDIPFLDQARLFLLYRGVYDSVYDTTPGFSQKDIYGVVLRARPGAPIQARLSDIPAAQRDSRKFDDQLREAYIDVGLKALPLSFRLGRQQIVWGETDNFRMLDRVNSLDLTWHLQQESWDELRIPYWMIKGLLDLDRLGGPVQSVLGDFLGLSNTFLESYWNPGDWYPSKRAFLPNPWSAPIADPLVPLVGAFHSTGHPNVSETLFNGTTLFRQGDYTRSPMDNTQVGVRFGAVTPQGVQFTLNYFYQRWAGDDGTNAAAFKGVTDLSQAIPAFQRNQLPIEAISPYVHTTGFSLNYAEEEYTQAVFRMETIYELGVPFTDASIQFPDGTTAAGRTPQGRLFRTLLGKDVFGVSKRDMWKGMLAFDRPTWIRALNRKTTFLILGQFFWHYLPDNPNILCNDRSESPPCRTSGQGKGLRGEFSSSGLSGTSGGQAFIDRVRDWEVLTTLAMTTFYRGGKIVPLVVYVLDPVNSYNMEFIGMVDYFLTNNLILNLSTRVFVNTTPAPVFESWGVAGVNRGRSEIGLRLTYQF